MYISVIRGLALSALFLVGLTGCLGGGGNGSSGDSAEEEPAVLSAPTGLTATDGKSEVVLQWGSVERASGYIIYWDVSPDIHPDVFDSFSDYTEIDSTTSYRVKDLEVGETHYFVVVAVSNGNESGPSEEVSATPIEPVTASGEIVSWAEPTFEDPPQGDFIDIAGGSAHSLAIRKDGSLAAWGSNSEGETDVPDGSEFTAIDAGAFISLALREDGSIEAWGTELGGALDLPEGEYIAIAADAGTTAGVRSDGSVVVAGAFQTIFDMQGLPSGSYTDVAVGPSGLIALHENGTIQASTIPVSGLPGEYDLADVPAGNNFEAIAMTDANAVALRRDGTIETWGADSHWIEENTPGATVTHAPNDGGFVAIDAGTHHAVALRDDGTLATWGLQGPALDLPQGENFVAVAAGDGHSLAISAPDD